MTSENEEYVGHSRRDFLKILSATTAAGVIGGCSNDTLKKDRREKSLFTIGLSQYSLHRLIRSAELEPVDYPAFAKRTFGITDIDIWEGTFPEGDLERKNVATELRKRADDLGSNIFLFMVGILDATSDDAAKRKAVVDEFTYWLDHAAVTGCDYYRIFLRAADTEEEVAMDRAADSLRYLGDRTKERNMKVIIEPAGSRWSTRGDWLAKLVKERELSDVVLMPDFGKLNKDSLYTDTKAMMPYTEVISAKSHEFNEKGEEVNFDYRRLFKIIDNAGFNGTVAIEYEGSKLSEIDGVHATNKLLKQIQSELLQG